MDVCNMWTSIFIAACVTGVISANLDRYQLNMKIPCLEDGGFYRNPNPAVEKMWAISDCSKYFLCIDGEVFEFKCSAGLLFDVKKQICDFKMNVDNCDIISEAAVPRPQLESAGCHNPFNLGCGDGSCIPKEFFCDGSTDCQDGSDEGWCDADHDPNAALPCDPQTCKLPDCYCSRNGMVPPNNMNISQIPQMIILTFDDVINSESWNLYTKELFLPERKNANGCSIKGTFFVSHQDTNYQQVQKLWNNGHEISVHSITHKTPEEWWSNNATIEDWFDEMVGQANIINRFAGVRMEDIRGMRVPFLRVGWNRQFLMMKEFGFIYDASMVAPHTDLPLWPYTLDHKIPHQCTGNHQRCPSRSYPGIWEMVINPLEVQGYICAMVHSCPTNLSGDDVYHMLMHNFKRHYGTNRAPFGLHFHATWFENPEYITSLKNFLDEMIKLPDVWFVTNWQAIQWMKSPTPINHLSHFEPWDCKQQFDATEIACNTGKTCKLHSKVLQTDRYLQTCFECPEQYPWIRNEFGLEN